LGVHIYPGEGVLIKMSKIYGNTLAEKPVSSRDKDKQR